MAVRHPELVVAGAVVVSLPMVPGILAGNIGMETAAVRFLIALVVCWIIGVILSWVFTTYGEQARRARLEKMIESLTKRDTDPAGGPGAPGRPGQ